MGELGALKTHLESDSGCGYILVECPNKCNSWPSKSKHFNFSIPTAVLTTMKRKDLEIHVTKGCYLRPYQCEFCGLRDTYKAITGQGLYPVDALICNPYSGHQAECPEAPLTCPNMCGAGKIKRKDMEGHRSQCPQETVDCPFAEAGCMKKLKRFELDTHLASKLQEHVSLMMKDYQDTKRELKDTKRELHEVKGTLFTAVHLLKLGTNADKEMVDKVVFHSMQLAKKNDSIVVVMPKFSEYRRSGKVWHSLSFYYKEGYKMCLAVYANGVGGGAGTHVSVALILLKGEHNYIAKQPEGKCSTELHIIDCCLSDEEKLFNVCQYQPLSQYTIYCSEAMKELSRDEKFCTHKYIVSKLANDCLTFSIKYVNNCYLLVSV